MLQATSFHEGMHVSSAEIYDASDICPVCQSCQPRQAVFNIQHDPEIDMLACSCCGAFSASHMPKPELLDRYYARYYAKATDSFTLNDPRRFARHVLRFVPEMSKTGQLRILDFGGGDGSLSIAIARELQSRAQMPISIAIDVVDYAAQPKSGISDVSITGHRELADVEGRFDLILASAIIEHIPDAHSAIRRLISLAGKRAHIYARTPFVLPIARLMPSLDITYPAHVHDMGVTFWNRFTRTFGLDASILSSRPSLVETTLRESPARTAVACALKTPALIELALFGQSRPPLWRFVGGWEVVLRLN